MLNLAIVGLGWWGQNLVNAIENSNIVRVVAAVTRTPSKVSDYCAQRAISLTDDYRSVLNNDAIDGVVIATPHSLHFDQIMMAAHAGKHVFCEKPFTLTADEARIALETLASHHLKIAIGHNRRFAPNTVALANALKEEALGQPIHIDGMFNANLGVNVGKWRDSRIESPAGGLTSLGIHVVDAFIHLFGRVSDVHALSRRIAIGIDIDDSTLVRFNFENGRTGHLTSIAATNSFWQVRAFGTGGWAQCTNLNQYACHPISGNPDFSDYPGFEYPGLATLKAALEAFATDIAGETPFPIPPEEILHATTVLEAITISARTGTTVDIANV